MAPNDGEEQYMRLSHREHIVKRPDTYVGSIRLCEPRKMWVFDQTTKKLVQREIRFIPALYKIFDEIVVNAADNKQRGDPMKKVVVEIDRENGRIMVQNDGTPVSIKMHEKENMWNPELIFGVLLTGSNFDDDVEKITGGRNGFGAKLTNIFSTRFEVECHDAHNKKKFHQVFQDNMQIIGKAQVYDLKGKNCKSMTRITFIPDLKILEMPDGKLDDDIVDLMTKRVYDLAGILGKDVSVTLNGEKVPINSFKDYVNLYLSDQDVNSSGVVYERVNDKWEVCIVPSDSAHFQQVSFVNGISTLDGGTHVEYIFKQLEKELIVKLKNSKVVSKKSKETEVKSWMIRNNLWIFINCLVANPEFDAQMKERLSLPASKFKYKCQLSSKFIDKVASSGLLQKIQDEIASKQDRMLKKSDGTKTVSLLGIHKLKDAPKAGGKESLRCTLILTEGDSAKSLAIAGIDEVDKSLYGVYPLKGKLLNVRQASNSEVANNQEITDLKKILGLKSSGKQELKDLRYGKVMIMTDQDPDGFHIKGLICNFFHKYYRHLLQQGQFLHEFITPLVKAKNKQRIVAFYNMPDYEEWKKQMGANIKGWTIKYYKGLGTSDNNEAKEYFREFNKHQKQYVWEADEQEDQAFELAFGKNADPRKDWLNAAANSDNEAARRNYGLNSISYNCFVNTELIQHSRLANERSIPSMVDGLKPVQRKILFGCIKSKSKKEVKVSVLTGLVMQEACYHHGEASLQNTIIGMAQNFPGSNNINLLEPKGQFGSRIRGGKDASAARYISTRLAPISRLLFRPEDDAILKYMDEEGKRIEPEFYVPIIPLVLVNGAQGIGTGYSTYVPQFKPEDIVENCKRVLQRTAGMVTALPPMELIPHTYKHHGDMLLAERSGFVSKGKYEWLDDHTVRITELPLGYWTEDFLKTLHDLNQNDDIIITDIEDLNGVLTIDTTVRVNPDNMGRVFGKEETIFKLTREIRTTNMTLFDKEGRLQKYQSAQDIIEQFIPIRLQTYEVRKQYLIDLLAAQLERKELQVKFIKAVVDGQIVVLKQKRQDIEDQLTQKGFKRLPNKLKKESIYVDEIDTEQQAEFLEHSYDYLLQMPIHSLTIEKMQQLIEEMKELQRKLEEVKNTTIEEMYERELEELEAALQKMRQERDDEEHKDRELTLKNKNIAMASMKGKKQKIPKKAGAAKGTAQQVQKEQQEQEGGKRGRGGAKAKNKAAPSKVLQLKPSDGKDTNNGLPGDPNTTADIGNVDSVAQNTQNTEANQVQITQFFKKNVSKNGGQGKPTNGQPKPRNQKQGVKRTRIISDDEESDVDSSLESFEQDDSNEATALGQAQGPSNRPKRTVNQNKKPKYNPEADSLNSDDEDEEDLDDSDDADSYQPED